ncbi:MAG: lytic murein transglycosylase [Desulfovibrio sp.]|jgi:membrane-bound lytic murein transglycosylase B|nr:lytic murein transglycosylase [Desulfovibrio sp.]
MIRIFAAVAAILWLVSGVGAMCADVAGAYAWESLADRMRSEGCWDGLAATSLAALPNPSPEPMGRKVKELYFSKFVRPFLKGPKKKLPPLYPNVVLPESAARCREYIAANKAAFDETERRFGVPPDIVSSLLYVETRLGTALGTRLVLYTLASMAVTRQADQLGTWLNGLDIGDDRRPWLSEVLKKRSDWAYKELKTFLDYCRANNIDPLTVPGSFYGALGICQFMPSSIAGYAADGNGDGVIDLFDPDDAVASVGRYLSLNGWTPNGGRKEWHAALKRYNHEDRYANTILALADLVRGDAPRKKAAVSKPRKR